MTLLAVWLCVFLLLQYGVALTADGLNLRQARKTPPAVLDGWFDPDAQDRSRRYLVARTRLGWIGRTVDLTVLLAFWFSGGFGLLDQWIRQWTGQPVTAGLIYIGTLGAIKAIFDLPLSAYAIFGVEARFGFNRTAWRTFWSDRVKGLLLAIVLGGPLLAAVLYFFQYTGASAWWICWLVVTGFMLVMQYVAPVWIMPLFNRYKPLEEGELKAAILEYARSVDFALDNVMVMDGSRRSSKSNAFFTGYGRHRRVVLYDTLIRQHGMEELVAVLAHEVGHFKLRHIVKMLIAGIVQSGLMLFVLSVVMTWPAMFAAFKVDQPSVYVGLVIFAVLYAPVDMLLGLAVQALSRKHELAADRFAVSTGNRATALMAALKKLTVHNLSTLNPHPLYVFLNHSHPSMADRIRALNGQG